MQIVELKVATIVTRSTGNAFNASIDVAIGQPHGHGSRIDLLNDANTPHLRLSTGCATIDQVIGQAVVILCPLAVEDGVTQRRPPLPQTALDVPGVTIRNGIEETIRTKRSSGIISNAIGLKTAIGTVGKQACWDVLEIETRLEVLGLFIESIVEGTRSGTI